MSGVFIIGNNNVVDDGVTGVVLINTHDYHVTSEDVGKSIFNNGALVINENGQTNLTVNPTTQVIDISNSTVDFPNATVYFIDCTPGDVDMTIGHERSYYVFIRTNPAGNDINLVAGSGVINSVASIQLVNQNDMAVVYSDGNNFFAQV